MKVKNLIIFIRNEEDDDGEQSVSNPEGDISGLWSGRFNKGNQGN